MGKNLWNRERVSGLTWDCRTAPSPSVEWWAVVVWSRWLRRATPGRARGVPTLPTFIFRVIKRVLKKQHPDLDPTVRLDIECDQKVLRSQVTIRNQAFFGHFKKTQIEKNASKFSKNSRIFFEKLKVSPSWVGDSCGKTSKKSLNSYIELSI